MKTNITDTNSSQEDVEKCRNYLSDTKIPLTVLEWIDEYQSEVIIIYDEFEKAIFVSRSIEKLLGYKPKEIIGTNWAERLLPEEKHYVESNYSAVENKVECFTLNLLHKDGQKLSTECRFCKLVEDNKIYYISIIKDMTDQKETEIMLVRSEKMSIAGQLAAGIAHEIRNPLTSIKGFLQLLQAGIDRKDEYYKIMIDEITKMEKITTELLYISKPLTDQKQMVPVQEMISDVVSLLETQARLKNIEICVQESISDLIYCDKSQIKQVLINIVKNAIEAMDQPGNIHINVITSEHTTSIKITDEGPGISAEVLHKLGEPFFTTKKDGTGLGLMISKQIMNEHKGTLEIISNESKGSTFILNFPEVP